MSSDESSQIATEQVPARGRGRAVREVGALFLKLGFISFGGPAAYTAFMEKEVVTQRGWITREAFLDFLGATNLIPGPNSTEMALLIGLRHAGLAGLVAAGAGFILPAVFITTAVAWAYVQFGNLPSVGPFVFGVKPAVLAVILGALWRLSRSAFKEWRLGAIGVVVAAMSMAGVGELAALFGGGIAGAIWLRWSARARRGEGPAPASGVAGVVAGGAAGAAAVTATAAAAPVGLWQLGLFFLKIGAVLYGTGYVLVAFPQGELVQARGWLTERQLLDAIAVGQFTPGPLLSTAAFVGYLLCGARGAAVSAGAVFLPSFVFVLAISPLISRLRQWRWTAAFLDAVNVSSLGLMAAVLAKLAAGTLQGPAAVVIAVLSAAVTLRWSKLSPAWLVLGGAAAGWVASVLVPGAVRPASIP